MMSLDPNREMPLGVEIAKIGARSETFLLERRNDRQKNYSLLAQKLF